MKKMTSIKRIVSILCGSFLAAITIGLSIKLFLGLGLEIADITTGVFVLLGFGMALGLFIGLCAPPEIGPALGLFSGLFVGLLFGVLAWGRFDVLPEAALLIGLTPVLVIGLGAGLATVIRRHINPVRNADSAGL